MTTCRLVAWFLLLLAPALCLASPVPETHPVRGPYEVGVYYYPGWQSSGKWAPILGYPERQPLLGWYREGDPHVAEWQIKWAAEHGITFIAYDWYWSKGQRHLEHALHEGFLQARNRSAMKFCLLWANHNPSGSHSPKDCQAVTRFWIDNYFRRPEYLRVGGKPVVFIFSVERLRDDLGSPAQVRQALDAMRRQCVQAGVGGLYLVACGNKSQALESAAEGYDAVSAYNWHGLGMAKEQKVAPFEALLPEYARWWQEIATSCGVPLLIPISGGWDSRPWATTSELLVRTGRTPANFRSHLMDARRMMDARSTSVLPLAIIEAWNEFGEGSYVEPHREAGFGYLDAVREVFTAAAREHRDLRPEDVGDTVTQVVLGSPQDSRWAFTGPQTPWGALMGMSALQLGGGVLCARTLTRDPAFSGPPLELDTRRFGAFRVRMRLSPPAGQKASPEGAQLFWAQQGQPKSEACSVRFGVVADGQWHDYMAPLAANPNWSGTVRQLRFDPCAKSGVLVELAGIEFVPRLP